MDITTIPEIITNVGFPIACVIGLAWYICRSNTYNQKTSIERENKLYKIINDCQKQLTELGATNAKFVEILNHMQSDIISINRDIDDIKDELKKENNNDTCESVQG